MRKVSLVLTMLVVLGSLPSSAAPDRRQRDERRMLDRVIHVLRSVLRLQSNGDGLTPPSPAPRP
jgi:hypothetical protein